MTLSSFYDEHKPNTGKVVGSMALAGMIKSSRKICGGSPVIAGTRVRVSDIARYYALWNGNIKRVCKALPHLSESN